MRKSNLNQKGKKLFLVQEPNCYQKDWQSLPLKEFMS